MKIQKRFKVGQTVKMTANAVENYGPQYSDAPFKITNIAVAYMHASEFFPNKPEGYHPGFDREAGAALYDLEGLSMSLYDWELTAS